MPPMNWAGNLRYAAHAWHTPQSIDELQRVVAAAYRAKAVGTRHSFTTIADTDGDLISLAGLPPEIAIDAEANTVTVTGGTRYGDLMPVLEEAGFALHNTGSLPHISIAGATATGTHGSGDGNGILSVAISALEVVRADGELVTIGADDPDMMGLAVGLGAFGVIIRVTLDLQPSYLVRQDAYIDAPWDAVLGEFDDIMASAYSVSLLGDFASPVVAQVWQKSRIAPGANDLPDPVPAARFGGAWLDAAGDAAFPNLNPRGGMVGPWSERMPHFRLDGAPSAGGDELQSEYFVPRPAAVPALDALRRMGSEIAPHLHIAEIRTVAADAIWLSPAYDRDSACIGFTWRNHPAEVTALLPRVERALAPFEPRPHWGKLSTLTPRDVAASFEMLPAFRDLVTRYDPAGKFSNAFLRRVLG
jgi:alditol oxidase